MFGTLGLILSRNGEKKKEENNMFPGDVASKTQGYQEGSLKLEYSISLIQNQNNKNQKLRFDLSYSWGRRQVLKEH